MTFVRTVQRSPNNLDEMEPTFFGKVVTVKVQAARKKNTIFSILSVSTFLVKVVPPRGNLQEQLLHQKQDKITKGGLLQIPVEQPAVLPQRGVLKT